MQRLRAITERLSANFFVVPAIAVLIAFAAARLAVGIDLGQWVGDATVESARAVMSTVAAATITFASIAFSVSLLIMQQGSTQFSPRVIYGLTRDPFNRRVIAFVVATFTFCLVVLQRTRGALEDGGDEVVPRSAVAIGIVLGIAAVLAVVGAIHHTARMMDVSAILSDIVEETLRVPEPLPTPGLEASDDTATPDGAGTVIRFRSDGWIGQIDRATVLAALPRGSVVRLETETGRYAIRSTKLCTIWCGPADDAPSEDAETRIVRAVRLGATRTMVEDRAFGVRQLVDIALKALSPGVNDPTTAQDVIFHLGTVLSARLGAPPSPTAYVDGEQRRLLTPHAVTDAELADLSCAELRIAAANDVTVSVYLLEMLSLVVDAARAQDAGGRSEPFLEQARKIVTDSDERVRPALRDAFLARFGP